MSEDKSNSFLKNYSSILLLLGGIVLGSLAGLLFGKDVEVIKPLGDIFLNLLFTAIIPLVIFTIASSIANLQKSDKLGKLFGVVLVVFLVTVIISAIVMIIGIFIFPVDQAVFLAKSSLVTAHNSTTDSAVTQLLTVNDFYEILSRKNMLALILFSFLSS